MPQVSKLSKAEWHEVREAAISGVPVNQIADRYDMEAGTIYVRAHRERWPMPARIKGMVAERIKAGEIPRGLQDGGENVRDCKKGSELIAESLLSNGEKGSLIVSNLALALLKRAESNPDSLKPLADVYDLTAGMKAVRLAAGMDKVDSQSVTVNVGGWQASVNAQAPQAGFREVGPLSDEGEADESESELVEPEQ